MSTEIRSLGDCLQINSPSLNPAAYPDRVFDVFSIPAFDNGRKPEHVTGRQIGSNKYKITGECVLVSKINPRIKRVWYIDRPPSSAICSTEFVQLTLRNGAIDLRFVEHFLQHANLERLTATAAQAATKSRQRFLPNALLSISFRPPPIHEQRRIVALLDRAAEIRRRVEAARAKARGIIPALFLDTFGDPSTNPLGWERVRLGNVANLFGGGTPSKANADFWGGDIPWVSPKDMKPPIIFDSEDKITEAATKASPAKLVPARSVLIVVRGMILAHTVPIRINAIPVTLNQDMKAIVPKRGNPIFLRWALQSSHRYLLSKVREAAHGTKSLESAVLTELSLIDPPVALQVAFAKQVERIETIARKLDAATTKAEAMTVALSAEVFGSH